MVLVKGAAAEAQRRTFGHDRVALGAFFVAIPAAFIYFQLSPIERHETRVGSGAVVTIGIGSTPASVPVPDPVQPSGAYGVFGVGNFYRLGFRVRREARDAGERSHQAICLLHIFWVMYQRGLNGLQFRHRLAMRA